MRTSESGRQSERPRLDVIGRLRGMIRRYILMHLLLVLALTVLFAFWLGFLVDWAPTLFGGLEMPRSARAVLLIATAAIVLVLAFRAIVGRLMRPLPDSSLALLLERQHPELDGRLITTVQVRPEADDHSPDLLRAVYFQTQERLGNLHPERVLDKRGLYRLIAVVAPLAVATIIFAVAVPAVARQASSRLLLLSDAAWPRKAELEMIGLVVPVPALSQDAEPVDALLPFEDRSVLVARGSSATLRIAALEEGRVIPDVCTVYYEGDDGLRGQANMRRTGRPKDGKQIFVLDGPPLDAISGDLRFDVRGLDARLDDFQIRVADPAVILSTQLVSEPPEYLGGSRRLAASVQSYQAGIRLREGSDVSLQGEVSTPLAEMRYRIASDPPREGKAVLSDDRTRFAIPVGVMVEPLLVSVLPVDESGITPNAATEYFLNILPDTPPQVTLQLSGIGDAVTPRVQIPMSGQVTDDHGIRKAAVRLEQMKNLEGGQSPHEGIDGFTVDQSLQLGREGEYEATLDLVELIASRQITSPSPGDRLTLLAEVSDFYDLQPRDSQLSDAYQLEVVSADELISRLERRELALRSRLEQVIREMEQLRESLLRLRTDNREAPAESDGADENAAFWQLQQVRADQADLQADKSREELAGIAASVADILGELINNRIDSIDRRNRLQRQVYQPLNTVAEEKMIVLRTALRNLKQGLSARQTEAADGSLATANQVTEEILAELEAVLEGMLELESYNELLDMIRGLIDRQEGLIEETKEEQKQSVLDLFE